MPLLAMPNRIRQPVRVNSQHISRLFVYERYIRPY